MTLEQKSTYCITLLKIDYVVAVASLEWVSHGMDLGNLAFQESWKVDRFYLPVINRNEVKIFVWQQRVNKNYNNQVVGCLYKKIS